MILYLSGPISSDMEGYRDKFNAAESYLSNWKGHVVLNPAWLPQGMKPEDYENIDNAMLDVADAIVMLRGWGKSEGARAELMRTLVHENKKVFYGIEAVPFAGEDEQDG